jgi:phosphoglycerate dehydrogenase-like enzyme
LTQSGSDPGSDLGSAPGSGKGSDTGSDTGSDQGVAVASHSFPKSETLKQELLARFPRSVFNETRKPLSGAALVQFLRGYRQAITGLEVLDESIFAALPDLRLVSKYGVGLDMIDFDAARRHGVTIRHTPGVNAQAVAELTIAFMIMLARRLPTLTRDMHDGIWTHGGGRQLSSATVGVVGCGHVGKAVTRLCRAFGARVVAHDIADYGEFFRAYDVTSLTLPALLAESDFVSIHVPLDPSTRGMIGAAELSRMKRGAFLINTARGGIVDERAVEEALSAETIAGAAFDVFSSEPFSRTELLRLPNFVSTPHVGGASEEAVLAMGRAAIHNLGP